MMEWPDGKKIAIMVAFDVDGELLWLDRNEENRRHITNLSRGHYSIKQGVPRILKMLEEEDIPATFFTPAYMVEKYPDVIKEIAARGHEIGYHGYLHEANADYEEEKQLLNKCDRIIEEIIGKKPVGNRAPNGTVYDFNLRLWLENGYIYSSNWRDSDGPFVHELDGKKIPIVELPKDSIFDDTAYDFYTEWAPKRMGLKSGREMVTVWRDEFNALLEEGRMINFVLHPQFFGRPGNIRPFREFLRYMSEEGAWFATNEQVARYILEKEFGSLEKVRGNNNHGSQAS